MATISHFPTIPVRRSSAQLNPNAIEFSPLTKEPLQRLAAQQSFGSSFYSPLETIRTIDEAPVPPPRGSSLSQANVKLPIKALPFTLRSSSLHPSVKFEATSAMTDSGLNSSRWAARNTVIGEGFVPPHLRRRSNRAPVVASGADLAASPPPRACNEQVADWAAKVASLDQLADANDPMEIAPIDNNDALMEDDASIAGAATLAVKSPPVTNETNNAAGNGTHVQTNTAQEKIKLSSGNGNGATTIKHNGDNEFITGLRRLYADLGELGQIAGNQATIRGQVESGFLDGVRAIQGAIDAVEMMRTLLKHFDPQKPNGRVPADRFAEALLLAEAALMRHVRVLERPLPQQNLIELFALIERVTKGDRENLRIVLEIADK